MPTHNYKPLTSRQQAQVRDMKAQGWNYRQVADALRISYFRLIEAVSEMKKGEA